MKNVKKIILGLGAAGAVVAPVAATVSCSLFGKNANKSSMEFWNYEDYMDEDMISQVDQVFSYSQFGDLPQFREALKNETAAGGIGSDYFNAKLAKDGMIQKIDFSRLYGIDTDRSKWAGILENYYSKESWALMKSFDGYMGDVDGDAVPDHLWEYMAPYFIQDKVVAVNINRLDANNAKLVAALNGKTLSETTQEEFEQLFPTKTYKGILDRLKEFGAGTLVVNNYMRDNMMIGSELTGHFTGNPIVPAADGSDDFGKSLAKAKEQIDGLTTTLSGWKKSWPTSGVETLESLINNDKNANAQVALMYNGDALYAWNGGEDTDDNPDNDNPKAGQIRIVTPDNPTFLLDGFVISNKIANNPVEMDRIYNVGRNVLYKGANTTYKGTDPKTFGYTSENNIFKNFDSVGYTPAFEQLYEYCDENYFDKDEIGKYIYSSTRRGAGIVPANGTPKLDENHVTWPLDDKLESQIEQYYEAKAK